MSKFQPHINPVYPANNFKIFEEWFAENYKGCNTDRELLPIFFTSFYVNNNYGNDMAARKELQDYLNSLDTSKKYFSIIQYDDAILDDVSHLDLLQFNMSKTYDVPIPLICQPHPYKFTTEKKWLASFVGSRTHPIRNELEKLKRREDFYISFEPHDIETYCRILHESYFVLCPRGYGSNSFRVCESLQYDAIPVYITDELIEPFNIPFYLYGVPVDFKNISKLEEWLDPNNRNDDYLKVNKQVFYEAIYTYEGCFKHIIKYLETEHNSWQQIREDVRAL